jgi:carbonic anhydrase
LISRTHVPTFKYSTPVSGLLYNSGHGPAFTVNNINGKDITGNPSFTWNGETLYLKSWVNFPLIPDPESESHPSQIKSVK